ncbi:hypothetical protein IEQ34_023563 [Dendrobium chrysotoxum]|uniref:Uncharacterized protein n=1 Tax=Dendrobium chrysotoxum TaxID=161865 RepID=A0AAV7FU72_DENCH|nr:hypothetical protein IEQ34_023563 [Dendrobium chrysotoxum]
MSEEKELAKLLHKRRKCNLTIFARAADMDARYKPDLERTSSAKRLAAFFPKSVAQVYLSSSKLYLASATFSKQITELCAYLRFSISRSSPFTYAIFTRLLVSEGNSTPFLSCNLRKERRVYYHGAMIAVKQLSSKSKQGNR